jgi:hypothetical protein
MGYMNGVHEWHFKDGAFETRIALKHHIDHSSKLLRELDILANSSTTSLNEKRRSDEASTKVKSLEGSDKVEWSRDDENAFEIQVIDDLREPFINYFTSKRWSRMSHGLQHANLNQPCLSK